MLTNKEMLDAIELAKIKGYISESYREDKDELMPCCSDCGNCPASETCDQLSVDKNYSTFIVNYKKLIDDTLKDTPSKSDKLVILLDKMRTLVNSGDTEMAHSEADDLLVEAIKLLSSNTIDKNKCNLLIEAYEDVDKWFG